MSCAGVSVRVTTLKMAAPAAAAGNQEVDPKPVHFADDVLHLANRPQFEIDNGRVLEEMPQEGTPLGEAELADAAFCRMTGGEKERGAQFREGACHFA